MNSLTQTRSIVLACALALVPAAAYAEETQHHWGYGGEHGPRHWAEMNAEYEACGVGKAQSPIDIRDAVPAKLDAIEFDYHPTPLHIIDNGHTIQVNYEPGSSISVGGKLYQLTQFHFHKPSEERINGKRYPMVAHLVHKNAEGELAVVAVLLKEGARNPVVKTLWTGLPKETAEGKGEGKSDGAGEDQRGQPASEESQVLHVCRVAHHASVQRRGDLVRAGHAEGHLQGAGCPLRQDLPRQRAAGAAAEWTRSQGEPVVEAKIASPCARRRFC